MKDKKWNLNDIPDLKGKVVIVTGGNSGLGYESVKVLASKGAEVILASRSMQRGKEAKKKILKEYPAANIEVIGLDLSDLLSVRSFAEHFNKNYTRLDVLLNNAGIMTTPYGLTKDGFESQFGTNHLGHFALTGLLMDKIKETQGARVVNVSSIAHKTADIDFENLMFEKGRDYTPMRSYRRSKLANLLFTYELQRYFEAYQIPAMAVAAHPGVSYTNLARHIEKKFIFRLLKPIAVMMIQGQEKGALPQIRASVDPSVKGAEYYGPSSSNEYRGDPVLVESTEASHSFEDARMLWDFSEKLTGVTY